MDQWEADLATYYARRLPSHQAIAEAAAVIALLRPHWREEVMRARKCEVERQRYIRQRTRTQA